MQNEEIIDRRGERATRDSGSLAPLAVRERYAKTAAGIREQGVRETQRMISEMEHEIRELANSETQAKFEAIETAALECGDEGKELFQATRRFRTKHGLI